MQVICRRNSLKLVKGAKYEVLEMSKSHDPNKQNVTVSLPSGNTGTYISDNFTKLDGTNLDNVSWISEEFKQRKTEFARDLTINDVRKLKKGDIIVCRYGTKALEKGKMYKVSEVDHQEKKSKGYNGTIHTNTEQRIKVEGNNRWVNYYRFRNCTTEERRTLSLGHLFDEKVAIVDTFNDRKIDRYDKTTQTRMIVSCLVSSMLDTNRNNLSIIDWAVQKRGLQYDLSVDDIKPFLDMKISDLIHIFENGI